MECVVSRDVRGELPESLQRLVQFEQRNLWRLERVRPAGYDADLDGQYLPENGEVFRLPCFWVARKHLYVYESQGGASLELGVSEAKDGMERLLLPIHPAEVKSYQAFLGEVGAVEAHADGLCYWATPTSSVRTVLVWPAGQPDRACFAKLSLRSRILGDRRLQRRKVAGSVGLSGFVRESRASLPGDLGYFYEVLGLVPRLMQDYGVIFRPIPEEVRSGKVVPMPIFALMGGRGANPPMFLELMKRSAADACEFIETVILRGFAKLWVDLVFESGILLEAHAQDLLVALSPSYVPTGKLYYRDFEGLSIDWALRRARRLADVTRLPHASEWFSTYDTWGYPLYQLASWKIRTSLFDYFYFVLAELDAAIKGWRQTGRVSGADMWSGDLTLLFSHHLRQVLYERFGAREAGPEYDVYGSLNKFVKFLMRLRREVMDRGASRQVFSI